MESLSLYIHIPFCATKCPYCDFNSYASKEGLLPDYVAALKGEIAFWGQVTEKAEVTTIYFGGGTPSLLDPEQLREILGACHGSFRVEEGAEISMEANPGTISLDY